MKTERATSRRLILFDGVCNLCHASVRWIIARDRREAFDFASLQSEVAREALANLGGVPGTPESLVLIDAAGAHFRSDAALRIARELGFPWSLAALARILPRFLRDGLYRWIAARRYRWFGRKPTCSLPLPGQERRFLDAGEWKNPREVD